MRPSKSSLLSTTVAPAVMMAGIAIGMSVPLIDAVIGPTLAACNPCKPSAPPTAGEPYNPCAAVVGPCAAGAGSVSQKCAVRRLHEAAANPCNPCAVAKACNPCNPCAAAKACNPCNPCAAAKACNPCNPCAAAKACSPCNPCNPCNPCAAAVDVELTDQEAVAVYDCLLGEMRAAYAKSENPIAVSYSAWPRYSTHAYPSGTHGERLVHNYANKKGESYGKYEEAGVMPAGSILVKDSFVVQGDGRVSIGPLFLMEKMDAGFHAESDDWRYTLIMPTGATVGTTKGAGSANVAFCIDCHKALSETDSMLFLPGVFRGS